jgi:tetratricopeptide (TPR) repeat protein
MTPPFVKSLWLCLIATCLFISSILAQEEPSEDVNNVLKEAVAKFTEGDYDGTLSALEKVKAIIGDTPAPQVPFLEGATYYNKGDHAKAVECFKLFVEKYPTDPNINQTRMALGKCLIIKGENQAGIDELTKVVSSSKEYKGEAGLYIADAYRKDNKTEDALRILDSVISDNTGNNEFIQACLLSAEIYINAKAETVTVAEENLKKAQEMMDKVKRLSKDGDNSAHMNNIYLKVGDQMFEKDNYKGALSAYQMVRRKGEILTIQTRLIKKLQAEVDALKDGAAKDEKQGKLSYNTDILKEIEERKEYDQLLYYRLARCYMQMGLPEKATDTKPLNAFRLWQAIKAFDKIVNESKEFKERDTCLYSTIVCYYQLKKLAKARATCEKYMEMFPEGQQIQEVSEMFGMFAYESGNLKAALEAFKKAEKFPKADKAKMRFFYANILFEQEKFEEARAEFSKLVKDFPQNDYKEDCAYRTVMSYFFQNDSIKFKKEADKYIKDYPKGAYVVDAKYRDAFINYQVSQTKGDKGKLEDAISTLEELTIKYPNDNNIPQVYSLLGDAYAQKAEAPGLKEDEAKDLTNKTIAAFENVLKNCKEGEVFDYAQEELNDLYVSSNQWDKVTKMWRTRFESPRTDEDTKSLAVMWISRSLVKENKPDEAKLFLSKMVREKISNPSNQQVEGLIQEIVKFCVPKKRKQPVIDPANPEATPPPPETIKTFEMAETELKELITPPENLFNGTASIRILFASTWLARLMKDNERAEKIFGIAVEVAKPNDLSPLLLSKIGDNCRIRGDYDKAEQCYKRLEEVYRDSDYSDGAAVGMAEIAFAKKDYPKALELFKKAISDYAGSSMLMEATIGIANCLYETKKYDLALTEYERIASTKEWKGEPTAHAMLRIAQIKLSKNLQDDALNMADRIILGQRRFKTQVAAAYILKANLLIKRALPAKPDPDPAKATVSDREAARIALTEFMAMPDVRGLPEYKAAEALLSKVR